MKRIHEEHVRQWFLCWEFKLFGLFPFTFSSSSKLHCLVMSYCLGSCFGEFKLSHSLQLPGPVARCCLAAVALGNASSLSCSLASSYYLPSSLVRCCFALLPSFFQHSPSPVARYHFSIIAVYWVLGPFPSCFFGGSWVPLLLSVKGSLAIYLLFRSWVLSLSVFPHTLALSTSIQMFPTWA